MGQDTVVTGARPLPEVWAALSAEGGMTCQIVMVDGQLVGPQRPPPAAWNEIRLRVPAGVVTLRKTGTDVAVVVFGNAGEDLVRARDEIARALRGGAV